MRRFLALILAAHFSALAPTTQGAVVVINSYRFAAGGGGPTADLFSLDFEETGTPAGVTILGGTPNFDNTTTPLAGAEDLACAVSTLSDWNKTFTASDEVWISFEYQRDDANPDTILYVEAGAQYIGFRIGPSGGFLFSQSGTNTGTETVTTCPTATHIYCRLHVKKGTGANAIYDLEFNTSNSFTGSGNKFTSYSAGNVTNQFVDIEHYHSAANTAVTRTDNLKGSSTGWPP